MSGKRKGRRLTEQDIQDIKHMLFVEKRRGSEIAKLKNVSQGMISHIKKGRCWSSIHIPEETNAIEQTVKF